MNRFGFFTTSADSVRDETYTIQKNDTLYKIAKNYGLEVQDLINANNLTTTQIFPNQVIVIPLKATGGAIYFEEYIINPNETLNDIALKIGVSPEVISQYNDIAQLVLLENQVLQIPKKYQVYIIEKDDTIETILNKTGMSALELLKANSGKWLIPGNKIYVI